MSEEEAFLRFLCEHPEDATARLVFADWCDENGKPLWARYLRRIASPPPKQWREKPKPKALPDMLWKLIIGG